MTLARVQAGTSEFIIGVDEVGYGCWAGPVTVCAAVVRRGWHDPRVRDSKRMTHERRALMVRDLLVPPTVLMHIILSNPPAVIDSLGLVRARDECVADAIELCLMNYPGSMVVMDGTVVPVGVPKDAICLPKADDLVPAVSAASVIAKESRDDLMREMHKLWPHYAFDTGMGYGTAAHEAGLLQHGACPIHRMSFGPLRKYAQKP